MNGPDATLQVRGLICSGGEEGPEYMSVKLTNGIGWKTCYVQIGNTTLKCDRTALEAALKALAAAGGT